MNNTIANIYTAPAPRKRITTALIVLLALTLALASCGNGLTAGTEATLYLNIGGNGESGARAAVYPPTSDVLARINYAIELKGSATVTATAKAAQPISIKAPSGKYTATVNATLDGSPYASGTYYDIQLEAGSSVSVTITMYPPTINAASWTAVPTTTAAFGTNQINAVAYGDGKFVAGNVGGTIGYSSDGVSWTGIPNTNTTFGSSSFINAIAYGNGKFVAGGSDGKMAYSPDGIIWTAVTNTTFSSDTPQESIFAIAYGNGKFVAGGSNGKMAYSSDGGINWSKVTNSAFNTDDIYAIAYGNGKFVAGGIYGKMAYSSDGITWKAVTTTIFTPDKNIESITYGNGRFIAGRDDGNMAYSSDGINWTAVTNSTFSTDESICSIAYGGKFIAVGGLLGVTPYSKMAYSADGITWTAVTDSTFGNNVILSIAYGGGKFVAVGASGTIAYTN